MDHHTLFSDQPSGSGCSGTGYFEVDNSKTWSKTIYLSYRSSRSCWWYIYNPNPKRQMVLTVDDFHVSHLILGNCMANWKGENRIYFSFFLSTYLENIKLFFGAEKWLCTSKIQQISRIHHYLNSRILHLDWGQLWFSSYIWGSQWKHITKSRISWKKSRKENNQMVVPFCCYLLAHRFRHQL